MGICSRNLLSDLGKETGAPIQVVFLQHQSQFSNRVNVFHS